MVIERRNRRYCTDDDLGSDHRSVTALFQFPCAKRRGLENNSQKPNLFNHTRNTRRSTSMEPRRRSRLIRKKQKTILRRYDEFEKSFTGKHVAAAHEESEILWQHTTAAAANDEAKYLSSNTRRQRRQQQHLLRTYLRRGIRRRRRQSPTKRQKYLSSSSRQRRNPQEMRWLTKQSSRTQQ